MTKDPFEPFQKLWNSFENFRKSRDGYQAVIDGTDVIDLGNLYHDIGLRHHSIRPMHEWNQYTAILDTASVTYAFESRTDDTTDQENANAAEQWFNAAILLMNAGKSPPLRLSRSRRVAQGIAIWKLDLNDDWFDFGKDFPFIWSEMPPGTGAWFEDAVGTPLFLERSTRAVNPLLKAFKLRYDKGTFSKLAEGEPPDIVPANYLETVVLTQVSTPETITYWAQPVGQRGGAGKAQEIHAFENPWDGRVPYVRIPALLTATLPDPAKRYQPLIYNTLRVAAYENYMKSLLFLAARLTAAPIYDVVTEAGDPFVEEGQAAPLVIYADPDKPMRTPLPPGARLIQREIEMGVDNQTMLDMLAIEADRVGFPSGLLGAAPEPRTPAYALAQAQGQASVFIDPATKAEEAALLELQELMAGCIKNYDGFRGKKIPIRVRTEDTSGKAKVLELGPENIGEHDVRVHSAPVITSLDMAQTEVDRKDLNEGLLSIQTYMTKRGITDVEKELRLIMEGQLIMELSPSVRATVIAGVDAIRKAKGKTPVAEGAGIQPTAPPGRTRPAQQVRPIESQPNPLEQVPV
jgi:hypothetical protein